MNVYEVKYEALWLTKETGRRRWRASQEPIHVLANDALAAIPKARRHVLKMRFKWTDDRNVDRTDVARGFRLVGIERLLSIDAC